MTHRSQSAIFSFNGRDIQILRATDFDLNLLKQSKTIISFADNTDNIGTKVNPLFTLFPIL